MSWCHLDELENDWERGRATQGKRAVRNSGGHKRWDSESLPPPLALKRPDRKPYSPMDLTTPIETHLQFWENAGKIMQISICFTHKSVDHRHQTRDLFFPITHCVMGLCQWKAPFLGDRPLFSFVSHFSCIFLAKMSSKPRYWSFRTGVIIIKFRLCSP